MTNALTVFLAVFATCPALCGQGVLEPHPYMRHGIVEHHAGSVTVKADFARPLLQAITAVREEYGWVVDYEDPPYSGKHDVMDMTNPAYRAAHPNASVVLGPAGGPFQSTYQETANTWSSTATERQVLEKIVSDYNRSGNPGNFSVRELPDGSFDVVGTSIHNDSGNDVAVRPILDTPVSVPSIARTYGATLDAILHALPAKASVGVGPLNLLMGGAIKVGGTGVPARNLIMETVATWGVKWVWSLQYDVSRQFYALNLELAMRVGGDSFGLRQLVPIGPGMLTSGSP